MSDPNRSKMLAFVWDSRQFALSLNTANLLFPNANRGHFCLTNLASVKQDGFKQTAENFTTGQVIKGGACDQTCSISRGHLYVHHEAWFVRYREPVRQPDGSIKFRQRAKKLGSVKDHPRESQIKPLFAEFMRQQNAGNVSPETCMTLVEFVEKFYLNHIEEKRASTIKSYKEIWNNHIRDRVGHIQMRESER
jgi:hypothetical protein